MLTVPCVKFDLTDLGGYRFASWVLGGDLASFILLFKHIGQINK